MIKEKPLDLLGPTHQRLIMHCLSEVSTKISYRESLEKNLSQWLRFECNFRQSARLASEAEFPETALTGVLSECSDDVKTKILHSLAKRPIVPSSIIDQIALWLQHENR